jgi:hypothetical protein
LEGKINKTKYLDYYIGANLKYFNFLFSYCRDCDAAFSPNISFDRLKGKFENDKTKYENWQREYYSIIDRIYSNVAGIFKKEIDFDYCIMIGFYNANGWTDIVDGKEIPIVALDYVVHPTVGIVLTHELVHAFHKSCAAIDENNILDVLFYEGLAVYLTKKLNPGYNDNIYLSNFDEGWYNSWIAWYGKNKYKLLKINEKAQCFVQGQYRDKEFPSRIGYYAGFLMIGDFVEKYGLDKIVNLNIKEIRCMVRDYFSEEQSRQVKF